MATEEGILAEHEGKLFIYRHLLTVLLGMVISDRKNPRKILERISERMSEHLNKEPMESLVAIAARDEMDSIIGKILGAHPRQS